MSVPITRHVKIETRITELDNPLLEHSIVTNIPADLFDEFLAQFKTHLEELEKAINTND